MMFNLEDEINNWLREIRRYPNFEDGDIAEIEDHIREVIEHGLDDGLTPSEAFMKATSSFGSLEAAGVEITKSKTSGMKVPKSDPFAHDYTSSTNKFRSTTIMFSNYAKIAARNVRKQKLYSFINILSLTIGLTATLLIFLFVHDELTFDQFNINKNNIYRVLQVQKNVEGSLDYKGTSHAISLGPEIVSNISGISSFARFFKPWEDKDHYIRVNDKTLVDKVLYGDFEVFNMFSFPILKGSIEGDSPFQVVLSSDAAYKYFGEEVAVGRTLSIRIDNSFVDFTVAAIMDNIPPNSSIQFDLLVNFSYLTEVGFMKDFVTNWGFGAINTYVQTEPNASLENIQPGLDKLLSSQYPYYAEIAEQRGYKTALDYRQLSLQPLLDIHFDHSVTRGLVPSSNRLYSILLSLIAIGILLIGCINFMNLSIGRSANRAKEIGLRKTIGATRNQLIVQFLSESIILSIMAVLMAFLTAYFLLPIFNLMTDKELTLTLLFEPYYFLLIIGLTLLTGLLSGIYPAFALSKFKVEDAFSGNLRLGGANTFTRLLVVVQFSLATLLIIGMIVITEQMRYIQDKDLGFNSEQVLIIPNNTVNQTTIFTHYKQVLTEVPGVLNVTTADQIFGNQSGLGGMGFEYKNKPMRVGIISVSDNYLETLGIQLVSGRPFDPNVSSDYTHAVIVNEACLKDFELNLNDVFESLGRSDNPKDDPVVIGVMKDFNYGPLTMNVDPMLIKLTKRQGLSYIMVKVAPENIASTIKSLDDAWKDVADGLPFEYEFLDDTMGEQYAAQKEWSKIISISMITAILLSCFGLFGLVAMAIAGKRSEIGVRKVLGAGIGQIVRLYSWQYTRLVLIAFIIAMPVSYFLLEKWLETFAYRINLDFKIYFIAGFVSMGIAWITIAYKIFEAALTNPAQVLRDE